MIKLISKKVGFLAAIVGAAVVGGATTALVSAAIPSANDGQIHACYRNNAGLVDPKGALRVVDADTSQVCGSGETALNWGSGDLNGRAVKDANGQVIGELLDADYEAGTVTAYNQQLDRVIPLRGADSSGVLFAGANINFYYQSSDCSGQPLIAPNGNPRYDAVLTKVVLFKLNTSFSTYAKVADNAVMSNVITNSWREGDYCSSSSEALDVYPATLVSPSFTSPVLGPLKF